MIRTDVEPADIIAHDDNDVGSALLLRDSWRAYHNYSSEQC
jgi:hypothetical protein